MVASLLQQVQNETMRNASQFMYVYSTNIQNLTSDSESNSTQSSKDTIDTKSATNDEWSQYTISTYVIIALGLCVFMAIVFTLFGLFMKAGAISTDPATGRGQPLHDRQFSLVKGLDHDDDHFGFGEMGEL